MDNAFSTLSHKGLGFRVNLTCNLNYLQLYELYGLYMVIPTNYGAVVSKL